MCSAIDFVSAYEMLAITATTSPRSGNVMRDVEPPMNAFLLPWPGAAARPEPGRAALPGAARERLRAAKHGYGKTRCTEGVDVRRRSGRRPREARQHALAVARHVIRGVEPESG